MRIKNLRFKGIKSAVIGSCFVDFDDEGVAEVQEETALSVKGLKGFEVLPPVRKVVQDIAQEVAQEVSNILPDFCEINLDSTPAVETATGTEFDFMTISEPLVTSNQINDEFAEKPTEHVEVETAAEKPVVAPVFNKSVKRRTTTKGKPTKKG
jgi:hypothetical protein